MKHIKTYENFLNESHHSSVAEWDPAEKVIKISGGIAVPAGIRCTNGKIETFYDGMRGSYTYSLGISCPERKWEEAAPDMIDDLNSNISWLGGLVSKPIDPEAKKLAIEIIKSNL